MTAATEDELRVKLARHTIQHYDGTFIERDDRTVQDFLLYWLDSVVDLTTRKTTAANYRATVNNYVLPYLGATELQKLHQAQVQNMVYQLLKNGRKNAKGGLSTRTVTLAMTVLRLALTQAVKWGFITKNVAELVDIPKKPTKPARWWTEEQAKQFLQEVKNDSYEPFWSFALATGMRLGELIDLRWKDIDFTRNEITVSHAKVLSMAGEWVDTEPKTPSGYRTVILPVPLMTQMKAHRETHAELAGKVHGNALVFPAPTGKVMYPTTINRRLRSLCIKAKVPILSMHGLRHTHASLLMKQGVSPRVVQERLGHSDIQVTLGIYSHVSPTMQQDAANLIGAALFEGDDNGNDT